MFEDRRFTVTLVVCEDQNICAACLMQMVVQFMLVGIFDYICAAVECKNKSRKNKKNPFVIGYCALTSGSRCAHLTVDWDLVRLCILGSLPKCSADITKTRSRRLKATRKSCVQLWMRIDWMQYTSMTRVSSIRAKNSWCHANQRSH